MFALSPHVSTTIPQGPLAILQESRNTSVGNMGRRNGSVRSVQRSMQFNQIGRLTLKPVELENTDVTAEPFSPGNSFHLLNLFSIIFPSFITSQHPIIYSSLWTLMYSCWPLV